MTNFGTFYLTGMTAIKEGNFGFWVFPSERFCGIRGESATTEKSNSWGTSFYIQGLGQGEGIFLQLFTFYKIAGSIANVLTSNIFLIHA